MLCLRSTSVLSIIVLLVVLHSTVVYVDSQQVCNKGSDCCNCKNNDECNNFIGRSSCSSGCKTSSPTGYDWGGDWCHIGNLALHKYTTKQSNTYNSYSSNRAVDGNIGPYLSDGSCIHTKSPPSGTYSWWWVDLEVTSYILNVTIYNRNGAANRLNNFHIRVGNSENISSHTTECGYYIGSVGAQEHVTIKCPQGVMGRYVSLQFGPQTTQDGMLHFCEAVVMGYQFKECPDGNKASLTCDTPCDAGRYGSWCNGVCKCARAGEVCDKATGTCTSGCQPWYAANNCSIYIPESDRRVNNVQVTATSSSVTLSWDRPSHFFGDWSTFVKYFLRYRKTLDNVWFDEIQIVEGKFSQELSSLDYNTDYEFEITPKHVAASSFTEGTKHLETVTTKCTAPDLGKVTPDTSDNNGNVVFTLSWEKAVSGCNTVTLTIEFGHGNDTRNYTADIDSKTWSKDNLSPDTVYYYRIIAVNDQKLTGVTDKLQVAAAAVSHNDVPIPLIIGVVAGVVVLIILAVIVLILWRRKEALPCFTKANKDRSEERKRQIIIVREPPVGEEQPVTVGEDVSVHIPSSSSSDIKFYTPVKPLEDQTYQNLGMVMDEEEEVTSRPIGLHELSDYITQKQQETDYFKKEFLELPKGLTKPHDEGLKIKDKNRFANIIAYDHSRVVLDEIPGVTNSDYVNASYIKGYGGKEKMYIAAQGPKKKTLDDFWRLIWQESVNIIVMVTKTVEMANTKCDQYWPNNCGESGIYGDITVTLTVEDSFATFTSRVFYVIKEGTSRVVKQLNYTGWPDKNVPEFATSLLDFRKKVRQMDSERTGPLMVHCSAGVGRTGTFIALDILLEQSKVENVVDPFGVTYSMREDRVNMIQTLDQYIFLHFALSEALISGETAIPCAIFTESYNQLVSDASGSSQLQQQFEKLEILKPTFSYSKPAALDPKNLDKNRDSNIIPANIHRPCLSTRVDKTTDYINAVYVEAYRKRNAFLLTQMPLPHTVVDLWRLVHDFKCRTIIMVHHPDSNTETIPQYWPDSSAGFGPFDVEVTEVDEESFEHLVIRQISVKHNKEEPLNVRHFQLTCWPGEAAVPESVSTIVTLYDEVKKWQQKTGNGVVIIQCEDGATRSGLVCAASVLMERQEIDQEVDVFQTVKSIRTTRSQLIPNMEQYKCCHDIATELMSLHDDYANFKKI